MPHYKYRKKKLSEGEKERRKGKKERERKFIRFNLRTVKSFASKEKSKIKEGEPEHVFAFIPLQ